MKALDLFAGIGGWDLAFNDLGIENLGLELDKQVCKTRELNGLNTQQAEITLLNPEDFRDYDIQVASPPCQGFSQNGERKGWYDEDIIKEYATKYSDLSLDDGTKQNLFGQLNDKRTLLIWEPLRFALECRPKYIACEQVPYIKHIWEHFGSILEEKGYNVWVDNMYAECYGVPQTRKRAILIASTEKEVGPPPITHQYFVKGEIKRGDLGVKPWVSIDDVLPERKGWSYVGGNRKKAALRPCSEPAPTMAFGFAYNDHGFIKDDHFDKLTIKEGLTLQDFPPEFELVGSKHSQYTQVGNAIPVGLAKAIIEELIID